VRDVLGEMALAFGEDAESMQAQGLSIIRHFLDRGILEPREGSTGHGR
jgi:hypothetical protein